MDRRHRSRRAFGLGTALPPRRLGACDPDRRDAKRAGWSGLLPHFVAACARPDLHGTAG